jgi:hypothetical protein
VSSDVVTVLIAVSGGTVTTITCPPDEQDDLKALTEEVL